MKPELLGDNTHSFIVKVWLEETAEKTEPAMWRGCITHVPNGERRHFIDLGSIISFIVPYLRETGMRVDDR